MGGLIGGQKTGKSATSATASLGEDIGKVGGLDGIASESIPVSKPSIRFHERIAIEVLKRGDIPGHIAFIMDGNRRYASGIGKAKSAGHSEGLKALKRCMEWCFHLGVREISVFAFAQENFKRPKEEVDVLMGLAKKNLREMANRGEFLDQHQIKVKICGDLTLCPPDVRAAMEEIEQLTANHKSMKINICFAYNSEAEIDQAVNAIKGKILSEQLSIENINMEIVFEHLQVNTQPDLVVRTSREMRLSNFLTLQSTNAHLLFIKENWPELSIISILKIILAFQRELKRKQDLDRLIKQETLRRNA